MSAHHDVLAPALAALRMHSATSYSWFGRRSPALPRRIAAALDPAAARAHLRYSLQQRLYSDFYCPGAALPTEETTGMDAGAPAARFRAELQAANAGSGSREAGWRVCAIEGDRIVVVEPYGLRLWVSPDEISPFGGDRQERGEWPELGASVAVRLPHELGELSPGFYTAVGDEELPSGTEPMLRLYWNLVPDAVVRVLRALTGRLNAARIPFRLKVLDSPARYTRCDAGVLYVPRRWYPAVNEVVIAVDRDVPDARWPATPAFTKRLAPGLALAEDPPSGESFGLHRCGLVAEGVIRAGEHGRHSVDDRLTAVAECFAGAGIDLATPYLNPGSTDDYPPLAGAVAGERRKAPAGGVPAGASP